MIPRQPPPRVDRLANSLAPLPLDTLSLRLFAALKLANLVLFYTSKPRALAFSVSFRAIARGFFISIGDFLA